MQRTHPIALLTAMGMGAALAFAASAVAHDPATQTMPASTNMTPMGPMTTMPMTGNQDYDFAMMMREHHKMALPMANKELKDGKDATLHRMAQNIITAQTKEIAQFDAWIQAHPQTKN